MNIVTLFPSRHDDDLLINLDSASQQCAWNSECVFSQVASLSGSLQQRGVGQGSKVLILGSNRVESYVFMLAVMNIGAIAVPVNPLLGMAALADIIHDVAPVCSLTDHAPDSQLGQLLEASCRFHVQLESNGSDCAWLCDYQSLLSAAENSTPGDFAPGQQAMQIHSSGSQGKAKVISLSHQNLFNYFHYHDLVHRQFAETAGSGDVLKPLINVFQPSHLAAFSMVMQAFLLRRPTCLMKAFDPWAFLQHMSVLQCHLSVLVPSMYVALLQEQALISRLDFSCWQLGAAVGEAAPLAMMEAVGSACGVRMFAGYGLTECLPGIAHGWSELHTGEVARGSCGKHLFGEARLVDASGNDSSRGELWLRNASVHRCYVDDTLNDEKMTVDGWLRTGDLFVRDESGNFFHKGRVDDMFVCNGKNIYPAEIESVLHRHPLISRALASVIVSEKGTAIPAVLIERSGALSEDEVISFFVRHGPSHAIPGVVCITDKLPELGPGKMDRGSAQRQLAASYRQEKTVALA